MVHCLMGPYSCFPDAQHVFLQEGATYFCVTPLAASLCGGASSTTVTAAGRAGGADADESAFIIVETNFRVRQPALCPARH